MSPRTRPKQLSKTWKQRITTSSELGPGHETNLPSENITLHTSFSMLLNEITIHLRKGSPIRPNACDSSIQVERHFAGKVSVSGKRETEGAGAENPWGKARTNNKLNPQYGKKPKPNPGNNPG